MMPAGAAASRGAQKVALATLLFAEKTSSELEELLDQLSGEGALEADAQRAVVREARREFDLATKVSKELVAREAEVESRGYQTWDAARKANDWASFAPVLEEIIEVKNEIAAAQRPDLAAEGRLYDAHVDKFERGMSAERLDEVFSELKAGLVPLLRSVQAAAGDAPATPACLEPGDAWDVEQQAALCREVAADLGFDFEKGRMDVSSHPFTGGPHPTDVRITTRYSTGNWLEGIAGTVHETGHAMYEQGRLGGDSEFADLPVSRALSMGVHESQSLLWERMVFQSRAFWKYMAPKVAKYFPHTEGTSPEDFYAYVNRVQAGLIRVDADELTYPLHIILRFDLERKLATDPAGTVADLPETWVRRMKEDLGVDVPDNAKGCLQDVHWSCGAFGYFPSYSLGAIMAAQLYSAAKKDLPGLEEGIAAGEFAPLREWLHEKIHRRGSFPQSLDEILTEATGEPLSVGPYLAYLQDKYSDLYDL
uniref:Carboxypeptidase Taq n=2 Tax=Phaeomonas parva TaxID=124430 RepID=A0A7S1TXU1_9STRA|mmetsp:Transcript_22966/g.71408  ORF Transcript_22966/g.71408 Transcript_22966/m.71408 type:complete len:481 (+) Transcript_22966:221-1663(+)